MKHFWALPCAAAIALSAPQTRASDIPLPQHKPLHQNATTDHATLSEARTLLEQINVELKKPVPPAKPLTTSQNAPKPMAQSTPPKNTQPKNTNTEKEINELQVSQQGDIEMTCGALSNEALRMRDIIYTTQDIKDRAKIQSHGITAAGAIGSFLIGSVTGGVGLALGGFLLDQNIGQTEDSADNTQDTAAQRRTLMMGIFNAKSCQGPLEHAMQNPEIFSPLSEIASIETAAGTTSQYND